MLASSLKILTPMIRQSWVYSNGGKEAPCLGETLVVFGRGGLSQDICVIWGSGLNGGIFQCRGLIKIG